MATYSLADLLAKSILLLISPFLTRLLSPEQYGAFPLMVAVWSLFSVMQFGGFDFAFQSFRAQTTDAQERERIRITSTRGGVFFFFGFWSIWFLTAMLFDFPKNYLQVSRQELLFFLLAQIPSSLAYWSIYIFRFMHLAMPYVRINLLNKVASILLALPVIAYTAPEERLLTMLQVIFVAQTLSLIWVFREFRSARLPVMDRGGYSPELGRSMFRFGLFLIPSTLVYSACVSTDRVLLGYFSTNDQVAILGLAVTLSSGVMMVKSWFSLVWDPHLVEWLATRNPEIYRPKLRVAITGLTLVFLSIVMLSKVWSRPVIRLIYPEHFTGVAEIIPFLILAGSCTVLSLVAIATVVLINTPRFRLPLYLMALVANAGTGLFLIPILGIKGAAIGTLAGEFIILLSWIVIGKYILKNLDLNWWPTLLAMAGVFVFIYFYQPGTLFPEMVEAIGLSAVLGVILVMYAARTGLRLFAGKSAGQKA